MKNYYGIISIMCRWFIYVGPQSNLKVLLCSPYNSLFKQSYKQPNTPFLEFPNNRDRDINVDGFGLGWYDKNYYEPCIYVNIKPPWNDQNLLRLSKVINVKLLFAHIRAIKPFSKSIVHDYNCHPFHFKNFMWMHNGDISSFCDIKKKIIMLLKNNIFNNIKGNTDSEYAFALFLNLLDETIITSSTTDLNNNIYLDPDYFKKKVIEVLKLLVYISKESNSNNVLSMNFAVTDGKTIICTRYINSDDENPPSLYYNTTNGSIIISSEPTTNKNEEWILIGKNKIFIVFENKNFIIESLDFL